MNLTAAQLKALQAVADGQVFWSEPIFMRRNGRVYGARKDVINALVKLGMIKLPWVEAGSSASYRLTEYGRHVLQEQKTKE